MAEAKDAENENDPSMVENLVRTRWFLPKHGSNLLSLIPLAYANIDTHGQLVVEYLKRAGSRVSTLDLTRLENIDQCARWIELIFPFENIDRVRIPGTD